MTQAISIGHGSLAKGGAPEATRNRLDALTGLRIFAALAVYFSHLTSPAPATAGLTTLMSSGYYGVTFFFVLSGFVLALNYFDGLRRPSVRGIWSFGVALIARVYPLYLLVLLYVFAQRTTAGVPLDGWLEHVLAVQTWDPNLAMAYNYNAPGWSIGVEFFLYATLPLLVPLIARMDRSVRRLAIVAGVVIAVMVALTIWFSATGRGALPWPDPGSAHRWLYRTPLLRMGDFVLGIVAARLYLRLRDRASIGLLGGALIVGALLFTGYLASSRSQLYSVPSWDLSYAVPAFALVLGLAVAPRNLVSRFMSIPAIVLLGEASYAFYLIHGPMIHILGAGNWKAGVTPATLFLEAVYLGIILAMAVGLHMLFERPARLLIRRSLGDLPDRINSVLRHSPPVEADPRPSTSPGIPDEPVQPDVVAADPV